MHLRPQAEFLSLAPDGVSPAPPPAPRWGGGHASLPS